MNSFSQLSQADLPAAIAASIEQAQSRIAPTWPLDQFIAVNPYWGWSDSSFSEVAKQLWKLANAPLTLQSDYFQEQWNSGQFSQRDLKAAIDFSGEQIPVSTLEKAIHHNRDLPVAAILITKLADGQRNLSHAMPWQQFVKHQISQHCAAYFDKNQAKWHPDQTITLYESWRQHTAFDWGPLLQMGIKRFERNIQQLPSSAVELIQLVLPQLGLKPEHWSHYLTALLIDVNGWAAWCSYVKWQANLEQQDSDQIVQLLAIRLAWEWVLLEQYPTLRDQLSATWENFDANDASINAQCQIQQLLLHALEHAYQQKLAHDLLQPKSLATATPDVQAVFCIDVRSEVYRRALEAHHPSLETLGFAGFFGLPISYRERGSALIQPQLPGLLAPKYWVSELSSASETITEQTLHDKKRWQNVRQHASSAFTFVETLGLSYGAKLIRSALIKQPHNKAQRDQSQPEPALALYTDSSLREPVGLHEQAQLAKQILIAMGISKRFSKLMLLAGHGAACSNNPHAASLDCGACGGQNGAINVRLLAGLLNNAELRKVLHDEGIEIPADTWFVAALHNTTNDQVQLYNVEQVPASHALALEQLQAALTKASEQSRIERASALGIAPTNTEQAFNLRTMDWAQIRPEWGLANNAAFIVAPRQRSAGLDLQGRAFLHNYAWENDTEFAILELIMTAPMIVTNWINMQYYASSVDPDRYGSGSKILHNVVGERIGVFEGNGGDLRIGLPWQSVHNGDHLMHTPLRLSVMIEAPQTAIDAIIQKHASVKNLVENGWLHLFQINAATNTIYFYNQQRWTLFAEHALPN